MITPNTFDATKTTSFKSTDILNDDIANEAERQLRDMKPIDAPAEGYHYEGEVRILLEYKLIPNE